MFLSPSVMVIGEESPQSFPPRLFGVMDIAIDSLKVDGLSWMVNGESACDDLGTPVLVSQFLSYIEEDLVILEWCFGTLINRHLLCLLLGLAGDILPSIFSFVAILPRKGAVAPI